MNIWKIYRVYNDSKKPELYYLALSKSILNLFQSQRDMSRFKVIKDSFDSKDDFVEFINSNDFRGMILDIKHLSTRSSKSDGEFFHAENIDMICSENEYDIIKARCDSIEVGLSSSSEIIDWKKTPPLSIFKDKIKQALETMYYSDFRKNGTATGYWEGSDYSIDSFAVLYDLFIENDNDPNSLSFLNSDR